MQKALHKKIVVISVLAIVITLSGIIVGRVLTINGIVILSSLFLGFSLISLISSFAIKFQDKNWIRKITKYSIILSIVFSVIALYFNFKYGNSTGMTIINLLGSLSVFLTVIYLFLYMDAVSITGFVILMILLVFGIFMKRYHLLYSNYVLAVFSMLLSAGSLMFGIRCLFLIEKNTYLKNVSIMGSCFLTISFAGQLFKMMHWTGAGPLVIIGLTSIILGSMYVLLTLHSSGFIDWQPFYKKIFRKILIPWTFIFILYISRFLVPELDTLIWSPGSYKSDNTYGFGMKDYTFENKNGINP